MKKIIRKIISKFSKYSSIYENSFDLIKIMNFYNIDLVLDVGASWGGYAKSLRRFGYKNKIISFYDEILSISGLDKETKNLFTLKKVIFLGDQISENDLLVLACINLKIFGHAKLYFRIKERHFFPHAL